MKIIPYLEISSKITTLIDSAEKELFIVSPFVNIDKWEKMKDCLIRARNKNVKIWFYVRKNAEHNNYSLRYLYEIGINPIFIENLHAKLYVNERYGIVSSQNLYYYSDIKSIDIGYQTENTEERAELIDFIDKAVRRDEVRQIDNNLYNYNSSYNNKKTYATKEKRFLEEIYLRFRNKYTDVKFGSYDLAFYSKNLFSFADNTKIGFNFYTLILFYNLGISNYVNQELKEKIIKIFEFYKFRKKQQYDHIVDEYNFYFEFEPIQISFIEIITILEKVTDEILVISKSYRETEQLFIKHINQKLKNKYPKAEFKVGFFRFSSRNLFPFIDVVTIHYNTYTLRIGNSVSSKLILNIINTFELHQFKTEIIENIRYKYLIFKLEKEINFTEQVNIFEKITYEILEISKSHIETEQLFIKHIHEKFKNKYPKAEFRVNSLFRVDSFYLFSKNLFPFIDDVTIDYNRYTLIIGNDVSSKLILNIINTFELHQFKTEIEERRRYKYFYFKLEKEIEFIEHINLFEKVTDEIIEILLQYERN